MKDSAKTANPFAGFMSQLAQGGASGLVSGGVSSLFSELFAESQQKRMRDNMRFQQQLNLDSLRKSPLATVQGLKNAGLNPALLNGQSYSGQVAMAQQSQPTGSLTPISLSDMFGAMNAKANARYANAMAEKQEIENENSVSRNKMLGQYAQDMMMSLWKSGSIRNGNPLYTVKENPTTGELTLEIKKDFDFNAMTKRNFNAGDYQALQEVYKFMKEVNYNDFNASQMENVSRSKDLLINNIVKDQQIKDPLVIQSIKDLPVETLRNLVAQTDDFIASKTLKGSQNQLTLKQHEIATLQKTYMENSSFDEAIKKISNPKSIGDFFKGVFLFILNFVRENVSLHK